MANILIVEDDEFFRPALKNILVSRGHQVTEAENGKIARQIINASPIFDVVISDIQMPFLDGVELLTWVKAHKPCPFILMTGFALVMETQKAHELGADDFLAKPFNEKELMLALLPIIKSELKTEAVAPVAPVIEYCKVSIDEFVSSPKILFDVYVKLGPKFVKIGHKGDNVPIEQMNHYREKGLRFLYVVREDFRQLVSFNINLSRVLSEKTGVNKEKKANFMRYTGEIILETAFINGVDKEAFDDAKSFLQSSLDILSDESDAFTLLDTMNAHADYLYAHSLCVSIYAVMIAKKMGWTSAQSMFKVSLSGLFHDIGKKEIDREILDKSRALLSQAERRLIESHPSRGQEILMSVPSIPSEVGQVAYEHHEDNLGTGFPRGVGKREIHPLTQIIRVANLFSEQVLKSPTRPGMTPKNAIQYMTIHFADSIDVVAFKALKDLFDDAAKTSAA
jgi:putative nucleotidyltransferase with HDIG domain